VIVDMNGNMEQSQGTAWGSGNAPALTVSAHAMLRNDADNVLSSFSTLTFGYTSAGAGSSSLAGGIYSTGGHNQTLASINVASIATAAGVYIPTIDMGGGGSLTFTSGVPVTWTTGAILRVNNWVPSAGVNTQSAVTPLKFGSSDQLTPTEKQEIHFTGYQTGAIQDLTTGEVLPATSTRLFFLGDVNHSGVADAADILPFEKALTNLAGYQQASGNPFGIALDVPDMLDIFDVNQDGSITNADLGALEYDLSNHIVPTYVPEPSTLALSLLGAVSLVGVARKRRRCAA
jgi:Dockerin type I domain/PEP-CTERM motif